METDVELACRCGGVHGRLQHASGASLNRTVCYCDDCQAYLHRLGRADLLDEHGGTEIVQVAPSAVTFDRGLERIAGLRLSPKGMYRWYASCCDTPLGNALTPAVPFIGIPVGLLRGTPDAERRDQVLGPIRARVQTKFATSPVTPTPASKVALMFAHVTKLLATWKLTGKGWPNPFFERTTGTPRSPVVVLTKEERDQLRPLSGPQHAR